MDLDSGLFLLLPFLLLHQVLRGRCLHKLDHSFSKWNDEYPFDSPSLWVSRYEAFLPYSLFPRHLSRPYLPLFRAPPPHPGPYPSSFHYVRSQFFLHDELAVKCQIIPCSLCLINAWHSFILCSLIKCTCAIGRWNAYAHTYDRDSCNGRECCDSCQ